MTTTIRAYAIWCHCDDCNGRKPYVGSTGKKLARRFSEHKCAIRTKPGNNRFYNHVLEVKGVNRLAIQKIGKIKLDFDEEHSKQGRKQFEQMYIDKYDAIVSGWNTNYAFGKPGTATKDRRQAFECDVCSFRTGRQKVFQKHFDKPIHLYHSFKKNPATGNYECDKCRYFTLQKKRLYDHIKKHQ